MDSLEAYVNCTRTICISYKTHDTKHIIQNILYKQLTRVVLFHRPGIPFKEPTRLGNTLLVIIHMCMNDAHSVTALPDRDLYRGAVELEHDV